jgi:hypothetical protein
MGKKMTIALVILVCLVMVGLVWAQTSPGYDLSWHVVGGGGRDMASAGHAMRSTLGQFAIGPAQGTSYAVGAGYWYGMSIGPGPAGRILCVPMVLKNH